MSGHPEVISAISNIYRGYKAFIDLIGGSQQKMEVTSGIISISLLKLVVYHDITLQRWDA